jgi:hypothetical protein
VAPSGAAEGLDVSSLDIAFDIRKTLTPKPNVGKITVRNLTREHRAVLETAGRLVVELHAGYEEGMSLLYLGEMRAAVTSHHEDTIDTVIQSGDKAGVFAGATIRVPVGAGTTAEEAIRLMARVFSDAGVGAGNLEAEFKRQSGAAAIKRRGVLYPVGGVLSGNLTSYMTSICTAAGLEWSIQDGLLVVLEKGKALATEAIVLSDNSGLVGSPSVSNKGYVKAKALLNPDIQCGRTVIFDTETTLQGAYRVEKCRYEGDFAGNAWYAIIEGKRI